ncbi:hypothetical protein KSF_065740 [Reticulibacter mediterranei]|uniref:Uncharacterized protein n=1 Tax=Reticulibacter mediterranei TaxID=2778369 RepID=A0A8J3IUN4_9CHLR|nr:hypothetical protein KSF_065740 [Reticulibacter mediterranei]
MMEIVRLILETTDNFLLLQAGRNTLQQTLIPMLEHMHRDQQASLERWQIEQDIYWSQMSSSVRPTMRWQQFSPVEQELSRKQRWVSEWYVREQQRLQERDEQLQEAMRRHEAHLEECASRFVLQALRPECVPAMTAVLQEHMQRLQARLSHVIQQAEAHAQQVALLQTQYQNEVKRLQAGQYGVDEQLAFGKKEATTHWVIKNLFGLGTPQSLTLTHQVYNQLSATNHLQAHIRLQDHFFWYCEQIWRFCEQAGLAARVQVLTTRLHHWHELVTAFDNTTSPVDVKTILLALVPNQ